MYRYKDLYTLDFTNVEHYSEMHAVIARALGFPEHYGCNWSAFWDCLTDMYGEPIHIEIVGLESVERRFGDEAGKMVEILKRFKHNFNDKYAADIQIEMVSGSVRVALE